MKRSQGRGGGLSSVTWRCGDRGDSGFNNLFHCSSVYSSNVFYFYFLLDISISCWSGGLYIWWMMGSQNNSCRALYLSTCSLVAWGIDDPVFEFVYGWKGEGYSYLKLCRCSMRESGMGISRGIEMGTWDLSDGGDGNLVGCCDECVGRGPAQDIPFFYTPSQLSEIQSFKSIISTRFTFIFIFK